MTTELKPPTTRANGAKSRGPKSPDTWGTPSPDSIQHGFTARKTIVLECENDDQFREMLANYVATYQPRSPVERILVDEMAATRWRMLRLRMIGAALLDREMNRKGLATGPSYRIAAAISLASRHKSSLRRLHERSHRMLRELQQTRKQQTSEPVPAAADEPGHISNAISQDTNE